MRRRRILLWLTIGLVVSMAASACSDDGVDSASQTGDVSEPEPTAAPEPAPTVEPEPEPTAAPEPEPTAEPTAEPEPTPAPEPGPEGRDFSAVDAVVAEFVETRGLNGAGLIVVHREDGVLHHAHFGEFDPDRISLVASSSKMISAGVLLELQEQGLLDIDAPVADAVPWGDGNPDITPAQLISNSSGLVGLGPDLLYGPYICQWLPSEDLETCGQQVFTTAGDDDLVVPPDTEFRYGGAQWQVAGALAEAVSGKSWAELIDETYVQPCGVDSLGYISLGSVASAAVGYPAGFDGDPDAIDPTANPNIEAGAHITSGDYGELLLMHLRGGRCGDTQVLSAASIDRMHADRIVGYGGNAGPGTGYGMGWWVDRRTGRIRDGGLYGSVPWLDLDDGYGAYLVIEATSELGGELARRIEPLVHTAVTGES